MRNQEDYTYPAKSDTQRETTFIRIRQIFDHEYERLRARSFLGIYNPKVIAQRVIAEFPDTLLRHARLKFKFL